jgi:MFS transporter, DHA2 family, multidrug resistance protein
MRIVGVRGPESIVQRDGGIAPLRESTRAGTDCSRTQCSRGYNTPMRRIRSIAPIPRPTIEHLRARHGARFKWYALGTVMVGTVAALLSATTINVAIPGLMHAFGVGQERAQWLSAGFMAAFTVSMLLTHWAVARYSFRSTYMAGLALLLASSVLGGLAGRFEWLLGMRIVQGAAAGLMQPLAGILIYRAFPPDQLGRAIGVFGFGVVLAPALGPTFGGMLMDAFSWRAIFFLSVPFCLAGIGLALRQLPVIQPLPERPRFDWLGFVLLAAALPCMLNGLVDLHDHGLRHAATLSYLALAAALAALFIWRQTRIAHPLLDPRLFRRRQFALGSLVGFTYGMGLFGSTYVLPLFVQSVQQYSPTRAGLLLMPAGLLLALTIPLAGHLSDRYQPRWITMGGLALFAASFMLLSLASPATSFLALAAWIALGRIGLGMIMPALNLGALKGIEQSRINQASGIFNFSRQLGGAIGISVIGIFLEARIDSNLAGVAGDPARHAAITKGYDETFVALACLFAIALLASYFMRPRSR